MELVAVGTDLRLPAPPELREYELVPPDDRWSYDLDELVDAAFEHGASLGLQAPQHEHDDPTHFAVLRLDAAWSLLELGGATTAIAANANERFAYLVLSSGGYEPTPSLGATTMIVGYATPAGWVWEGDAWKIRPHPRAAHGPRGWTWRSAATSWGGHSMTVDLDASADEIAAFVAASAPSPYTQTADARHDLPEVGILDFAAGRLHLWRDRGRGDARPHVEAFDRGVLLALARGALGPIRWANWEHDWETPCAIGDDGASLVDYLLGDRDAVDAAQTVLLAPRNVDLRGVAAELVAPRIAAALGAGEPIDDASFDAWLAARPLAAVPRHVVIHLDRITGWSARLKAAQPRVLWQISAARWRY